MIQVKGIAIVARLNYLKEKALPDLQEKILSQLRPEFQQQIQKGLLTSQWYSFNDYIELTQTIDRTLGKGDSALVLEMARYSADHALHGIYRLFYKVGSPEFVIKQATRIFNQYYSSGLLRAYVDQSKKVRLVIEDFEQPTHEHCLAVIGWAQRVLELSGAKNVVYKITQCRQRGYPNCEFAFSWN